jgi:hypothetical protein
MSDIVHLISGDVPVLARFVSKARTRCGRTIDRPMVDYGPVRYRFTAHNGNIFTCTLDTRAVTCVKCRKLIGPNHAEPSRAPSGQKCPVEPSDRGTHASRRRVAARARLARSLASEP